MQITLTSEQIQDILASQPDTHPDFNGTTLEYYLDQYIYALKQALRMLTYLHTHINEMQISRADVVAALQKVDPKMTFEQAQLFYAGHKAILNNEKIMPNVAIKAVIKPSTRKPRKPKPIE